MTELDHAPLCCTHCGQLVVEENGDGFHFLHDSNGSKYCDPASGASLALRGPQHVEKVNLGPVSPTMGGSCKLVYDGDDDGMLWYRCTVHSTTDHDELVIGTDVYCEKGADE